MADKVYITRASYWSADCEALTDAGSAPLDYTGGTVTAELRSSNSGWVQKIKTSWTDASLGTFNLSLSHEQTKLITKSGNIRLHIVTRTAGGQVKAWRAVPVEVINE